MLNILAAVALVAVLIIIHEAGHLIAAKLCGVEVPVFSIGFGRRLFGVVIGGTDYRVSVLPFGGYVLLAGADPFGTIETEDAGERGFLRRPLWQRIFVIAAGPLANLLLPVVVFSTLLMIGEPRVAAVLGASAPPLDLQPDDRIVAIDGTPIQTWQQVIDGIGALPTGSHTLTVARGPDTFDTDFTLDAPTTTAELRLTHRRPSTTIGVDDPSSPAGRAGLQTGESITTIDGATIETWWDIEHALARADDSVTVRTAGGELSVTRQPEEAWGIASAVLFVGTVSDTLPGDGWGPDAPSPAAAAGLRPGDHLVAIGGEAVDSWQDIQEATSAAVPLVVEVIRAGQRLSLPMTPAVIADHDERGRSRSRPVLGISAAGGELQGPTVLVRYPPLQAVRGGVEETVAIGGFMVAQLGHLATGEAALSKSVGGPVEMVRQASAAAQAGLMHYARLMGILSLSVGIINLLPVPVLDGGQLFFFLAEALRGRPLPLRIRERAQQFGVLALTLLMLAVLVMDIHRLLVG